MIAAREHSEYLHNARRRERADTLKHYFLAGLMGVVLFVLVAA